MTETIVVGTDGSQTATQAVAEATRMAKALGGDVHVVSAYESVVGANEHGPLVHNPMSVSAGTPEVGAEKGVGNVLEPLTDSGVDAILAEAESSVRLSGVNVATRGVKGHAADALLEVADEVGATLIVVGNTGRHGIKEFVLGNVASKVTHGARCNVLIVAADAPHE
jgi:nucleotide-binding universal stress UspA family protein